MSAYLQNGGIQKSNLGQTQTHKNFQLENAKENDEIKVEISQQSKTMIKIDDFQKQLEEIFGVKKELSPEELEKEKEIKLQIQQFNNNVELPYSKADIKSIEKIDTKIQEILTKSYFSYQDDGKLFDLTKQIEQIAKKYGPPTLSQSDKEKVEKLEDELHTLYGYKVPEVPQLIEAEKIYTQIDMLNIELKIKDLDKNSDFYATENKELLNQLTASEKSLKQLDNSKIKYEKEEIRENSKNLIKNSLANINSIKDSFYNGIESSSIFNMENYGLTKDNVDTPKENKWLDFLQSSRKELYTGSNNLESTQNEENTLSKLMSRVRTLHEQ